MHPTHRNAIILASVAIIAIAVGAYAFMSRVSLDSPIIQRTDYSLTGATFTAFPTPIPSGTAAVATPNPPIAPKHPLIRVVYPPFGQKIGTPVTVSGEARGNWFFEASFPVRVLDANGKELGRGNAQANGNWMTEDFVPFTATVSFTPPSTTTGMVVFEKSNASGLPEQADRFRIPVAFDPAILPKRTVKLYYYDRKKDEDATGNVRCDVSGLTAVERSIPVSVTPIQDVIRLLLKGEISAAERAKGISSEYPLPGFELKTAGLQDGVLTLTFNDPQGKTIGGSCRVGILSWQIVETAKQFPTVKEVRFEPQDGVFQP